MPDRLGLVINNAGLYGPVKAAGQSLDKIRPEDMMKVFDTNCVGAQRVIQSVKNSVIKARGTIANVSSRMGSSYVLF
ncbi:MAG TPA: SDR family NAD(P)-dependent oxidoreductase [Gammaproteobacteria bacterium]|nr:SDR family NAD(P)-dependent oxidoreductase [Gammaproteobacteria bacterium]